MYELCKNHVYLRLFIAQIVALIGTGLLTIALGLLAYDLGGANAGAIVGTAMTIKILAYVGVSPIMGKIVEKFPTTAVLVSSDVVRGVIALCLPLVTSTWQIYLLVFLLQSASATFTPTFQSLIPSVLPDERLYTRALSLSRMAYDAESVVSPIVAGGLLSIVTYHDLFIGTAAGFALSALLVLSLRFSGRVGSDGSTGNTWASKSGLLLFARLPSLRFLMIVNVVAAAGTSLVLVNSVMYSSVVFEQSDSGLTWALGAFGCGSILMACMVPRCVERRGLFFTMRLGLILVCFGLLFATIITQLQGTWGWYGLLCAWCIMGAGCALAETPGSQLLVNASTTHNRHLVYTAQFALSHACYLVGYPLAGWLGSVSLLAASGLLFFIAVCATIISFHTRIIPLTLAKV